MTAGGRSSTSSSPQHMRCSVAARLPAVHRVAGRLNDAPDVPVEGRELYRPAQRPAEPGQRRGQAGEHPGGEYDLAVPMPGDHEGLLAALRVPGQAPVAEALLVAV